MIFPLSRCEGGMTKTVSCERGEGYWRREISSLSRPTVPPWCQDPPLGSKRGSWHHQRQQTHFDGDRLPPMLNGPTWCLWTCWSASWGGWHTGWCPRIRSARYASLTSCRAIPAELGESGPVWKSWSICPTRRCTWMGTAPPPTLRRRANWSLWKRRSASWCRLLCRSVSSDQVS